MKKVGLDDYLKYGASTPKQALSLLRNGITPWIDGTMNDTGNANIFVELYGSVLCYLRQEHAWRQFDGRSWQPNRELEALAHTEAVSAKLLREACTLQDETVRKQAHRWAMGSGNESRRKAMLALAEPKLVKDIEALDADPLLFNCQNGVINLRKHPFQLLPHDPSLMLGRISPVTFDRRARCPEFERFLRKVVPNARIRAFLQRMAGYALTGLVGEHCFFIFYGLGRNGKSTLIEVLTFVWGQYSRTANGDTFLLGRRVGSVRDDVHALRGSRLVKAVETGKRAILDEATIKEHTGGDTVTTRALYGQQTEWKPSHKLILVTNEKPHIEGTDEGIWSRVRMVPFEVVIPERERVLDYFETRLKTEASGILNWALEGWRNCHRIGLAAPEEVKLATQRYREDENVAQQFLDSNCVVNRSAKPSPDGDQEWATPEKLQAAFRNFAISQGTMYRGVNLKDRLEQLGFTQQRAHKNRYWLGIKLKTAVDLDETSPMVVPSTPVQGRKYYAQANNIGKLKKEK